MAFPGPVWLAVQEELLGYAEENNGAPSCFDHFDDKDLFEMFHLTRPCISFITEAVRVRMKAVAFKKPLPSVDAMIMVSLHYYAHGVFNLGVLQRAISSPPASLTAVVSSVSGVLAGMSDVFISFPLTPGARERTAAKMEDFCRIPGVLGVLAPAHFKIRASPYEKDSFKCFVNALGYTSVVSQFICDSEGNILSVEKCCAGNTPEQEMWQSSFQGREVEEDLHGPFWLIGGKGYNPSKHVLTPVLKPANNKEVRFNEAHTRAHNVMQITLGSLKRRFSCLMQLGFADEDALNKKSNIIKACSVLHNIAKKFSVPLPPESGQIEPLFPGRQHLVPAEDSSEALNAREKLIDRIFSAPPSNQGPSGPSNEEV